MANILEVPPATGFGFSSDLEYGSMFALIGTYSVIPLGSTSGGISLGDGWEFVAIVPYFVGYNVCVPESLYHKEIAFYSGPPISAFIGSMKDSVVYYNNRLFQAGVSMSGLPALQNWEFISSVNAIEIETKRGSVGPITSNELSEWAIPFHIADSHRGFFARFSPSVALGTSLISVFGNHVSPSSPLLYPDYAVPSEAAERNFHYVYLPTSFQFTFHDPYIRVLNRDLIDGANINDILWHPGFVDDPLLVVKVAGRKGRHVFTSDRYNIFDGAIIEPGWIECMGRVRVGSIAVESNPLGSTIREYWDVHAVVLGSLLINGTYAILSIGTGVLLPSGCVVTYLATEPLVAFYTADGSQRVWQICFGRPIRIDWYPQVHNFREPVIRMLKSFLNSPSYYIIADECDTPFITVPNDLVDGSLVLACIDSLTAPLGWAADWMDLNYPTSASAGFYYPGGLDYQMLIGSVFFETQPSFSYEYWHFRTQLTHYVYPFLNQPLHFPSSVPGPYYLWPDGYIRTEPLPFEFPDLSPFQVENPHQVFEIIYLPSAMGVQNWKFPNSPVSFRGSFVGSGTGAYFRATTTFNLSSYILDFAKTWYLSQQVQSYDWQAARTKVKHTLVIEKLLTPFGKRYAEHIRIDREVSDALLRIWLPEIWIPHFFLPTLLTVPVLPLREYFPKSYLGHDLIETDDILVLGALLVQRRFMEHGTTYWDFNITQPYPVYEVGSAYRFAHRYIGHWFSIHADGFRRLLGWLGAGSIIPYQPLPWAGFTDGNRALMICGTQRIYLHPGFLGATELKADGSTILTPAIHPAPAPFTSIGQVAHLGTLYGFLETYQQKLLEPAEKFFEFQNPLFPLVNLFGTMQGLTIFHGEDYSIFSYFVNALYAVNPTLGLSYFESADPRYREPALMEVLEWRYDNPFNTSLPIRILENSPMPDRRMKYEPPLLPKPLPFYSLANYIEVGSVLWNVINSNQVFSRLLYSHRGWRRTLPAGIIYRIPSVNEAIIRTQSKLGLDSEVTLMRKIVTMGNTFVDVYPRFAVINGTRRVRYFTQDGGRCPLWQGEPIVGVDAYPLIGGEVRIFVYTTLGVYSFSLSPQGVFDWVVEPMPIWFGTLLGR